MAFFLTTSKARLTFAALAAGLAACAPIPNVDDAGCVPTDCASEQRTCGSLLDGCGQTLECGPPCEVGDGGAPDAGPEDAGTADAGGSDAGPCDGGSCPCTPESPAAFCLRHARSCGTLNGTDNCGQPRSADCGSCVFPQRCDAGACSCIAQSCADVGRSCGEAYDGCGSYRDCGPCADGGAPPPHPLRAMAANTSSGPRQSYDPGEGLRIFQGLRPDLALVQELNYGNNSEPDVRRMIDTAFGPSFFVYREPGVQLPNAVVSRYPIRAAGSWQDSSVSNRGFAWARIDVPGPRDLWAVSVHLLTTSQGARNTEATQLVGYLRQAVPAGDYLVVGGDLNTGSRSESCLTTLSQVVGTAGPYPADQSGNTNTNATRSSPLDWVMVNGNLRALHVPVAIGPQRFDAGLVFDSRVYQPLSDVAPVLATDSAAQNMQHMGVVRDFLIP